MLEIATIARPYAEAAYQVAKKNSDLDNWETWLSNWAQIACRPDMRNVIDNPKVTSKQLLDLFLEVSETPDVKHAANFLQIIIENSRTAALLEIYKQFKIHKSNDEGIAEAIITSAYEMNEQEIANVMPYFEKKFGCKLKLTLKVDENLIGGIRVMVGDQEFDTSVRAQLEAMKSTLIA